MGVDIAISESVSSLFPQSNHCDVQMYGSLLRAVVNRLACGSGCSPLQWSETLYVEPVRQ